MLPLAPKIFEGGRLVSVVGFMAATDYSPFDTNLHYVFLVGEGVIDGRLRRSKGDFV